MLEIDLDNLKMNTGSPDWEGCLWWVTSIEGWDSPDWRVDQLTADTRHGGTVTQNSLGTRSLTLNGVCRVMPDIQPPGAEPNFWFARDNLIRAISNFTTPRVLTVYEHPYPKFVYYLPGGPPKIVIHPGWFEFSVQLICEDPRKYGTDVHTYTTSAGSGSDATIPNVLNLGSFPAPATVAITGLTAGSTYPLWRIKQEIASVQTGFVESASNTLVNNGYNMNLNQRTYADTISGKNRFGSLNLTNLKWFDIQPGQQALKTYYASGSGISFTISYRSVWL